MKSIISKKIFIFLIPFFLGLVTSFSLTPYNYLIINFFTFPFLLFFFIENYKKSKWNSFNIGLFFGFGYFISNLYWITNSLTFYENYKYLIPAALIIIPLFLGIFYGLGTLLISFFKLEKKFSSILIFSLIFAIIEFIRGFILGGFPWNVIGYSWTHYPYSLQVLSLIGTYSFNLLCITIFLLPSVIFFKKKINIKILSIIFLIVILVTNHLFGVRMINENNNKDLKTLDFKIKIISPKVDIKRFLVYEDPKKIIYELITLSNPNPFEKTIFIFPEGILPGIYFEDLKNYKQLFSKHYSDKHTIVMGINSTNKNSEKLEIYNSLAVFDNKINLLAMYNKNKLVPFGEFLPLEKYISKFGFKKITAGYQSFSSGKKRNLVKINDKSFLPLICYEIIYSGTLKKMNQNIDFIINISEDGWFGNSIGPYQHFSHSTFRAIEEGKNLIRSANNGISAYINSKGQTINIIKSTEKGVLEIKNFKESNKTFFSKYGNNIFLYFLLFYITLIFFLKKENE